MHAIERIDHAIVAVESRSSPFSEIMHQYCRVLEYSMKYQKQSYVAPHLEIWRLSNRSNLLNFLSTEGEVIDLLPGDAVLEDDEWDQFGA